MAVSDKASRISRGDARTHKDKRELIDRTAVPKLSRRGIEHNPGVQTILIGMVKCLTFNDQAAEPRNIEELVQWVTPDGGSCEHRTRSTDQISKCLDFEGVLV